MTKHAISKKQLTFHILCDIIYYAIGGEVYQFKRDSSTQHKEITTDTNNYVKINLEINNEIYFIKKGIYQ